ncbi:MAG: helix-turn-helix transcriptional regulator [Verrucomicrobia bacterium]|jgi:AraC-like DNA-binding protein|nr:helix-turn-helix transcriptional regulator [Verrucomicrobiota bacterium]
MTNAKAPFISKQVTSGEYYYLNLIPPRDSDGIVVCGGREQCAPTYRIERDGFKFLSLEFVSSGRGTLTMGGETYPLRPGTIFSYGPRVSHVIQTDPAHPLLKHFVDFVGSSFVSLLKTSGFDTPCPLYASKPFRMRTLFENLLQTGATDSRHRDELCVLLLRQLILHADETALPQQEAFSPAWQTYMRCRQHIEQNFLELHAIREAADACFINQAYLSRLFKRFADESPLQLLTRLKMAQAAELLGKGDQLIKQVAEQTGYADPYHFSRVFKRVYGIPPETFIQTIGRT